MLTSKKSSPILDELAQHKRFKIANFPFYQRIDPELQKAVCSYDLPPHSRYLSDCLSWGLMIVSLAGRKISTLTYMKEILLKSTPSSI